MTQSIKTLLALLAVPLLPILLLLLSTRRRPRPRSVAIVVLGDIGRSPRMLYHAQSFVQNGFQTSIIAYEGSAPPSSLTESPLVTFIYLPIPLAFVSKLPRPLFIVLSPFKVLLGAWALLVALWWRLDHSPQFIMVQNPPSIPTLPIVKLALFFSRSRLVIDWHNTAHSILALRLGNSSPVVKLAKSIEIFWGSRAYAHLCVTEAMRSNLIKEMNLKGRSVVFHDRPPSHFRRQTPPEAHALFQRLPFLPSLSTFYQTESPTLFTSSSTSTFLPEIERPALLVSATSWTNDEDFSILLDALSLYEKAARSYDAEQGGLKEDRIRGGTSKKLPRVLVLITGKGAGKERFENEVERLEQGWEYVRVKTSWLALEDYPKLLGSADLGISLHASSSGADLPMKIVDMFGANLPVLALEFACIDELVQEGKNGRVFKDAEGMADLMIELLRDPQREQLKRLSRGIKEVQYAGERWCEWEENWKRVVGPLVGTK